MPTVVNADVLIKLPADIPSAEITDRTSYTNRWAFLRAAGTAVAAATGILSAERVLRAARPARHGRKLENVMRSSFSKRKTQMFNGYGEQVASLYAGMDLRRDF